MRSSPTERLCRALALVAALLLSAGAGRTPAMPGPSGANHALLIGVMGYPALRERDRLIGPGNDIALVADYLRSVQGMADADIAILLDDGIHAPATLAAIRGEMARLAATVAPGDFVYLHFSGHGTQAPAPPGTDEPDGLDELFLPYDVGFWNGGTGEVENALRDDEIGTMIDAIRARGANVWAVFDACNAGTATRGGDEVRLRRVAPEVLGIPSPAGAGTATATAEAPFDILPAAPGAGTLTAFFAAQADQSTPEMNLPRGAADRRPQGLFTYTVLSELAARPDGSFADLATAILARYATEGLAPGTVPGFEGALDIAAFGVVPAPGTDLPVWPVTADGGRAGIPAGALHGLAPGDRLAVLPADPGPGTAPLTHLTLDTVAPLTASGTLDAAIDLPAGAIAAPLAPPLSVRLDLAMPDAGALPLADAARLIGGLTDAAPALAQRLSLVPAGSPADLRLVLEAGRITLVPGGGIAGDTLPATLPLGSDLAATGRALAPLILREARALLLTRAAAALPARLDGIAADLAVAAAGGTATTPLDPARLPALHPGDVVSVSVRNDAAVPVDIDVLYIAADRTIQHLRQIRTRPGDRITEPLFRVLPNGYGQELILIVQRRTTPGAAADPLTFLATGAAPTLLRAPGDDTAPSLSRYLAEAGFGTATRGPRTDSAGPAAILLVPVLTRPAP